MTPSAAAITLVGHASFTLHTETATLLVDPWLDGRVFDGSWALRRPAVLADTDLSEVTHLWLSHDHPDHFHVPSLRHIARTRPEITVLYQRTRDRSVVNACRELGFASVVELDDGHWVDLAPDLAVVCVSWSSGDSILVARVAGQTIVNTNDAMLGSDRAVQELRRRAQIDGCDVLLTQYSYARWCGNPCDVASRQRAARVKLDALARQARVLRARWVIPVASDVSFCHEENAYMNDARNTTSDAAATIRSETASEPVVLSPGQRWVVGAVLDRVPIAGVDLVEPLAALTRSTTVAASQLEQLASQRAVELMQAHGRTLIALMSTVGLLPSTRIWIDDHQRAYRYHGSGRFRAIDSGRERCDVALSSSALAFALRHLFGGSTLWANGRFEVPDGGRFRRFRAHLALANFTWRGGRLLRPGRGDARRAFAVRFDEPTSTPQPRGAPKVDSSVSHS